ncbi:MAG: PDZ domain-containing protein [Chloroflexi bacterium]|nr:PDZ domain-containing protein [Chloroflexota bacterium]
MAMMRRSAVIMMMCAGCWAAALAPVRAAPQVSPPIGISAGDDAVLPLDTRRLLFDEVWHTVQRRYVYADFRGVDWTQLYVEYAPRIEQESDRVRFYALLTELVARLNDGHSRFVPPVDAVLADDVAGGNASGLAIGALLVQHTDGVFVRLVYPQSPAERAGLRPRDRIVAVDGHGDRRALGRSLEGKVGDSVRLTVARPGDSRLRDVVVTYDAFVPTAGPTARWYAGDVVWLTLPTLWVTDLGEQLRLAFGELFRQRAPRAIVLDLRGNRGGWSAGLVELLGSFVRGQVGSFYGRDSQRLLMITGDDGPDLRGLPLVVLVDSATASYAEVLAAVLQREAGATVIGVPSSGNTETIYAYTLFDGSRLWLAQERFELRDGRDLEGVGVVPDVAVASAADDWIRFDDRTDPYTVAVSQVLGLAP